MKKNLAKTFALVMVLGGVASCGEKLNSVADTTGEMNEIVDDEIGTKVALNGVKRAADGITDAVKPTLGVLLSDGTTKDTYNLRFVAALTSYDEIESAAFTRDAITKADGTTKEAATLSANYVYTSVKNADQIKWFEKAAVEGGKDDTTLGDQYKYFMVYTLRNIPATEKYDQVKVSVSIKPQTGDNLTSTQTANIQGVEGDPTNEVKYIQRTDLGEAVTDQYYALKANNGITNAYVNDVCMTINGFVATKLGTVTALGLPGGFDGCFEKCAYLTSVHIPDSITYFNKYCFNGCSRLSEITFPKNLAYIGANAFGDCSFNHIIWDAKDITTFDAQFGNDVKLITMSKDVTALPTANLFSSGTVHEINYGGTTAEWAALIGTKENGLNIENVVCSDTVIVDVNFHLGDATLTVDGTEYKTVYTTKVIKGKKVANPGSAVLSGKFFFGWYTDNTAGTEYDFTAAVTGALDLYARIGEMPAGTDMNKRLEIGTAPYSHTFVTTADIPSWYLEFTAPATDVYYFYLASDFINDGTGTSNTTYFAGFNFFETTNLETKIETSAVNYLSTAKVQKNNDRDFARVTLAKDEKIVVQLNGNIDDYGQYKVYGTFDFKIDTVAHDSISEALLLTYNTETTVTYDNYKRSTVYKFTAPETKAYSIGAVAHDLYGSFEVYSEDDLKTKITSFSVSSSDTKSGILSATKDKKYYILAATNGAPTDEKYVTLKIVDAPAGVTEGAPLTLTNDVETTTVDYGMNFTYFTMDVEAGTYRFLLSSGSTYYAKQITITSTTGDVLLATKVEEGESEGDGYGGYETYYGTNLTADVNFTAAQTIKIKAGYSEKRGTTPFKIKASKLLPGDTVTDPLTTFDPSLTTAQSFTETTTGHYYKFTALVTDYHIFTLAGESPKITIMDSTGKTTLGTTSSTTTIKLTQGVTYVLLLAGNGAVTVTLTHTDTVPPDGKGRDTAYVFTPGADGYMTIDPTAINGSDIWFKLPTLTAKTSYKVWSNNDKSNDTKIMGVYVNDSSTNIGSSNDDDRNKHTETQYQYDFYTEFTVPEGTAADAVIYMNIKIENEACNLKIGLLALTA
ncbi:MAG: leucine-rich repeat protein [Bacilli bacterium]